MSNIEFITDTDGVYIGNGAAKRWLFSPPIKVIAYTRNEKNQEWGRLVETTDLDGHVHQEIIPMSVIASERGELTSVLSSMGVRFAHSRKTRELIATYIQQQTPLTAIRIASRIGWHGKIYVFPDTAFGHRSDNEEIRLESLSKAHGTFKVKGTLDDWQSNIGRFLSGNSRLSFSVLAAFAPPLIQLLDDESGGFHLVGPSSIGKTTLLSVAGSIWGGGGINGYTKKWKATINGLEGIAAAHCDAFLPLDEFGEVEPRDAGNCAYMIANQSGKIRADRFGRARDPYEWRLIFLSTGEVGLADHMGEANKRVRAGQETRMADINADADVGFGIFENLHEFKDGSEFSRHLKEASLQHYGTPIRAYLENLVNDLEGSTEFARSKKIAFLKMALPDSPTGQVRRVAERFALVAAAGCLAVRFGVLPLSVEECFQVTKTCFDSWLSVRGGNVELERKNILIQIREYFQRCGSSDFETLVQTDVKELESYFIRPVSSNTRNRGGFRKTDYAETTWYVYPEFFHRVICKGINSKLALKLLREEGHLLPDKTSKGLSVVKRFYGLEPTRYYQINSTILGEPLTPEELAQCGFGDAIGNILLIPNGLHLIKKGGV